MTTNENAIEREIYWYYLRNIDGHPFGTVALYKEKVDGKWIFYRGISICAEEDKFIKKTGRDIAVGRMIKAIKSGKSSMESLQKRLYENITIDYFDFNRLHQILTFKYYSEYDCKNLSEFEMRILFRPDESRD